MRKVHLDFESRSQTNIWDTGCYVYASDPSTEIVCLAYAVDNEPVKKIRFSDIALYELEDPFEELKSLAIAEDTLFYAHNALFEQLVWRFCMQERFDMPRMPINKWRCTAAKALAHGLPKSLKDAARAMGLGQQKDTRGKYLIQKLSKPQKDGTFCEDPELMAEFEDYCGQDVETERELDHMLPELHPFEQYVWYEDQLINQRGIAVDTEAVDTCLKLIDEETAILKKEIFDLTDGRLEGVSRRLAVLEYFAKKKHPLPDFTKATVENAVKSGALPPDLVEILRVRQQLGMTSVAKYSTLKAATCQDNRLKDILLFHSASTGRWGGKLVQMQNLPKGSIEDTDTAVEMLKTGDLSLVKTMYGNVMNLLSSCIRGMFVAPEGCDLIVSDYSAIEARVLMWFCGQDDAVKMFRDGVDIYVQMAGRIGGNATRQLGKQAVLGCGYGMGHVKFQATCQTYGIQVDEALAQRAVNAYRDTFKKVPAMWYAQERAMKAAIQTKKPITCGRVRWDMDARGRDFLYCTLPSGRRLAFHKPSVEGGSVKYFTTDSYTKKYIKKETYGGKIIENCLAGDTRVVTVGGIKNIVDVKQGDKVWDGENWVSTDGVIKRGTKETGTLAGIRLTAEHKILVGKSWECAIDVGENSWQDALKSGQSLADFGYLKVDPETTAKLLVSVIAEQQWLSIRDNYLEAQAIAGIAAINMQLTPEGSIKTSCPNPYLASGTWPGGKPLKKLWHTTEQQEEVFDLLNCGPNHRFTILSGDGPVVVHNCIQAIARDILAQAMLKAEKAGYKIVLTVHDELVAEVPEKWGSVEEFNKIITAVPEWAGNCPIDAEGWRGKRYKK
uniref:Putative DNA polymerase n=1 Tax=viral metagenome TaxID=1070528 RepID=A0A6M3KUA2_9ZZZZ